MLVDITDLREAEAESCGKREENSACSWPRWRKTLSSRPEELAPQEHRIEKSEERYHKMIEEVEDYAILLMSREGFVQNWNKGAEKIKGYREDEIIGKHFSIFYLPEDREQRLPWKLLRPRKTMARPCRKAGA